MKKDLDWNNMAQVAEFIYTWANNAFPGRRPDASMAKLVLEEIPEMLAHKKEHGIEDIGTELADCFILLMDLSILWHVDLSEAIRTKMMINIGRSWVREPGSMFWNHTTPNTERNLPYHPDDDAPNPDDSEGGVP